MLELTGLTKYFDGIVAVNGLSYKFEPGKVHALIGPNGSGKTTAFNLITGFLRPDNGEVLYKSEKLTGKRPHLIVHHGIGRTFQNIRLFAQLTVIENLLLALDYPTGNRLSAAITKSKRMQMEESANREKAEQYLALVGLMDKKDELAENMSYGQRRLVEICRTLALDPDCLLLDEPMAGLFPQRVQQMKNLLLDLKSTGKTIIFIEHDMNVVMDISDNIVVLNHGELIASGIPSDIQKNDLVIEAYLGRKVNHATGR